MMPEPAAIDTLPAAFLAGLLTSLHCVGMCGPLACSLPGAGRAATASSAAYHAGRFLSYSALGALFGLLGARFVLRLEDSGLSVLPWFLLAFFLLTATGLDHQLPRLPVLARWLGSLRRRLQGGGAWASLGVGVLTPMLPCGPLYLMLALALSAGSAFEGASILLAFSLGTMPLLFGLQAGYTHWKARLGPIRLRRLQRGMALAAALLLALRLVNGPELPTELPAEPETLECCPLP